MYPPGICIGWHQSSGIGIGWKFGIGTSLIQRDVQLRTLWREALAKHFSQRRSASCFWGLKL